MPEPFATPRTSLIRGNAPATTILQTVTTLLGEAPEDSTPSKIAYVPNANITGAASPASRTLTVVNKGQAGAGTAVLGTLAFVGGVNGAVADEILFTLTVVAADLLVSKGDVLALVSVPVGGTGLVDPGGEIEVSLARR